MIKDGGGGAAAPWSHCFNVRYHRLLVAGILYLAK
jgi:hypothetical protein